MYVLMLELHERHAYPVLFYSNGAIVWVVRIILRCESGVSSVYNEYLLYRSGTLDVISCRHRDRYNLCISRSPTDFFVPLYFIGSVLSGPRISSRTLIRGSVIFHSNGISDCSPNKRTELERRRTCTFPFSATFGRCIPFCFRIIPVRRKNGVLQKFTD